MLIGLISLIIQSAHAVPLSSVPAGGLVISEIMHDPVMVADFRGEYIEIYNAHTADIDINGLVLNSGEGLVTVNQSITVPVGGYAVVGTRKATSYNGGNTRVSFEYNYNSLKLLASDTITISFSGTTFDTVTYNSTTYPIVPGAAMILDTDMLTAAGNDSASNWCTSGTAYGLGDFGTPGVANDGCYTIADAGANDLVISEIMPDPLKVADFRGEWFEIFNTSNISLNVNGLQVSSTGNNGFTVNSDVIVPAKGYAVFTARSEKTLNGGVITDYAYSYSDISFGNSDNLSISYNGTTFDTVAYVRSTWNVTEGFALNLTPSLFNATSNDNKSNWCAPSSTYGDGDYGTPGGANTVCSGVDGDGDGFAGADDCDDTDASVTVYTYYRDIDSDTYGNTSDSVTGCSAPAGYVEVDGDCNDNNSSIYPTALEVCDGIDNDCDTLVDDNDAGLDLSTATTYYADTDTDSFGDDNVTALQCDAPIGYIEIPGDCNDSDANINPDASDILLNGIDENCDGVDNTGIDNDGDGFTSAQGDCNDNNINIFPGADEICDGKDNDCDGKVDDNDLQGVTNGTTWFLDNDTDGYGGSSSVSTCARPANTFASATDCDDSSSSIHPGATEIVADGIDQNCTGGDVCYVDADNDGFRTTSGSTVVSADLDCLDSGEAQSSDPATDCDDTRATVYPNAPEICDSRDNDCDSLVDANDPQVDLTSGTFYYRDADGDLYGNPSNSQQACSKPTGYVANNLDCDDSNSYLKPFDTDGDGVNRCQDDCDDANNQKYPGNTEICDSIDNDCDTVIDNDAGLFYYADADLDTFGDPNNSQQSCSQPVGYLTDNSDCDDTNANINSNATEIVADGIDQDCDGGDVCYVDSDDDGYRPIVDSTVVSADLDCLDTGEAESTDPTTDCDDNVFAVNPGATEICDLIDNDCDTQIDDNDSSVDTSTGSTFFRDADSDTFGNASNTTMSCSVPAGYVTDNTDCDDADASKKPVDSDADGVDACTDCDDNNNQNYPGNREICDSLDNDCDGIADDGSGQTYYRDADNDGYGTAANTTTDCSAPIGYVDNSDDCDDASAAFSPDALEVCLDGIDNDCDGADSTGTCSGDISNDDFTVTGISANDRIGQSVTYAGNITGTSTPDYAIGSRWRSSENGAVYVFAGGTLSGTTSVSNADVIINGQGNERFGYDVAGGTTLFGGITSDFNGDGNDDLLVGAPNADVLGDGSDRGAAYLFYGPLSGTLSSSDANVIFTAQTQANNVGVDTGATVAFIGDIDGDGLADIVIGDPVKQNSGASNGEAYLIFGRATDTNLGTAEYSGNVDLSTIIWSTSTMGQEINSDEVGREQMGHAIDAIGDVNGDGIDDLMITGYRWDVNTSNSDLNQGAVFVWHGGSSIRDLTELSVSHTAANSNADIIFIGANAGDQIGRSASGAGDFNGDGLNDIVIGSEHANALGGAAYVVKGNGSGTITLNTANSNVLVEYVGSAGETAGRWVSSAGNLDGDALNTSDILIGAKLADANGVDSGAVYVMMGGPSVTGTRAISSADAILAGEGAGNESGMCISGLDDINGDGVGEILIGSYRQNSAAGAVQLIFGGTFQ